MFEPLLNENVTGALVVVGTSIPFPIFSSAQVTVSWSAIAVEAARANVASESKNFFILLLCFELYVFFIVLFVCGHAGEAARVFF